MLRATVGIGKLSYCDPFAYEKGTSAMRARHISSSRDYRYPFGAVQAGSEVTLRIDVWDEPEAKADLHLWVEDEDDENGGHERLVPMHRTDYGVPDGGIRFEVTFVPEIPDILWYSFNITAANGDVWRYGAREGSQVGEGAFAYGVPPSFQITVYDQKRETLPTWYKDAIVYQIFPDRFARDENWQERAEASLDPNHKGIPRRIVYDWNAYPRYDRKPSGGIASWDMYGGSLEGIRSKLDYLESMGITAIYLNPIFMAQSNHRYDTADYLQIDPMLGTKEDFERLCTDAAEHGISIILDGVFNHTGRDSRYFDYFGNYAEPGAYQSEDSPYRSWYTFNEDGTYQGWWGNPDLPEVNEYDEAYREFICGENGVVRSWLRAGARGWRLDVADELPDEFIKEIKAAALAEKPDSLLIGEVWEDATTKHAYGRLRKYFQGDELDGTMNYPVRHVILDFLTLRKTAQEAANTMQQLCENYPREPFLSCLNLLGSHDRIRLLTILGDSTHRSLLSDEERYHYRLDKDKHSLAVSRLWAATLLQMTLPGVPCVYYGDEAGLEGYADPYCRATYPWDHVDENCRTIYRNAIAIRKAASPLHNGNFEPFAVGDDVLGFWRVGMNEGDDTVCCILVNRSLSESHTVRVPVCGEAVDDVVSGREVPVIPADVWADNRAKTPHSCESDGSRDAEVFLWPLGTAVVYFHDKVRLQAPMDRAMGIVAHITSVPNEVEDESTEVEGDKISLPGTLGEPAKRFVDYLASCGQRYWQVLPVNPTDEFGSPYAGLSAFAGNVALVEGLRGAEGVDGDALAELAATPDTPEFLEFVEKNRAWLIPYATFRAIKAEMEEAPWQAWPEKYREYDPALSEDPELAENIRLECKIQWEFQRQWDELHQYAAERGVKLIGDLPMYVSADSSDVWCERELFCLDEDGRPFKQAGAPPDPFAEDGQLWGNPTYNWSVMRDKDYDWWMRRLERMFELYDYVRLDHFLGFSSYYTVPQGKSAKEGSWNFGPGMKLFRKAYAKFGPLPVIAEDLGIVTPAVRALVASTGFPGMDVIQFKDNDVREKYESAPGKMAYSGTHDTQTLLGWCEQHFFGGDPMQAREDDRARWLAEDLLRKTLAARATVAMLPLQDVLGLDDRDRMNVPGVSEGNWSWQATSEQLEASRDRLRTLAEESGRKV